MAPCVPERTVFQFLAANENEGLCSSVIRNVTGTQKAKNWTQKWRNQQYERSSTTLLEL